MLASYTAAGRPSRLFVLAVLPVVVALHSCLHLHGLTVSRTTAFEIQPCSFCSTIHPSSKHRRPRFFQRLQGSNNDDTTNFDTSTTSNQSSPFDSLRQSRKESEQATLQLALLNVQQRMDWVSTDDRKRGAMVEQRESMIPGAGFGLFATQSIQAGTVVSYYPVHRIGVEYEELEEPHSTGTTTTSTTGTATAMTLNEDDETYFSMLHNTVNQSNYLHFLMGRRPLATPDETTTTTTTVPSNDCCFQGGLLYIDVNPQRPLVSGWMSHLVNDGAIVNSNTEQGVLDYYAASNRVKNCVHVPFGPSPILATVTTRKVKKGQELLTTYGCTYWLDALRLPLTVSNDVAGTASSPTATCSTPTDITDAIQVQVTETARDILTCMQGVVVRRQNEVSDLHRAFHQSCQSHSQGGGRGILTVKEKLPSFPSYPVSDTI